MGPSSRPVVLPLFIPFEGCPHRCLYCDQRALTGSQAPAPGEIGARLRRFLDARGAGSRRRRVEAAFYGGSFTSLPRAGQERYLAAAQPFLATGEIQGLRLSARPDAVDGAGLDFLAARGVTTIELGLQSMDDEVLSLSGRGHTAADSRRAALMIRRRGFSLGLQMMTGLPGDTPARALRTGLELAGLVPDFVRIYPALVIEGTPLAAMWRRGDYRPWPLDRTLDVLSLLLPMFRSRGIPLARVGLLLDRSLTDGGRILDGPVHPALGWLAMTAVAARRLGEVSGRGGRPRPRLFVSRRDLSLFTAGRTRGEEAGTAVTPSDDLPAGWFREEGPAHA